MRFPCLPNGRNFLRIFRQYFDNFIACYELIQMIIDHNNLANFETWIFFKWVFKTFAAVTLITNTFNRYRREAEKRRKKKAPRLELMKEM